MDKDKERQEISLLGRLLSLEALLVLMGALSLFSGILANDPVRIAFGTAILLALIIILVRRKKRLHSTAKDISKPKERKPDA